MEHLLTTTIGLMCCLFTACTNSFTAEETTTPMTQRTVTPGSSSTAIPIATVSHPIVTPEFTFTPVATAATAPTQIAELIINTVTPEPTPDLTHTPFPTIAIEDFNGRTVLEVLYGDEWVVADMPLQEEQEWIRWQMPSPRPDSENADFWNDFVYSKAHFAATFQEGGIEKFFLLTKTVNPKSPWDNHATYVIGGAIFSNSGDNWQVEAAEMELIWGREFRHWHEGEEIIQIGPDKYGLLMTEGFWGTGLGVESAILIAQMDDRLEVILFIDHLRSWNDPCEEGGDSPMACFTYSSVIEFIPGNHAEYYDCRVVTSGTGWTAQIAAVASSSASGSPSDKNEIMPFDLTRTYSFSEMVRTYTPVSPPK